MSSVFIGQPEGSPTSFAEALHETFEEWLTGDQAEAAVISMGTGTSGGGTFPPPVGGGESPVPDGWGDPPTGGADDPIPIAGDSSGLDYTTDAGVEAGGPTALPPPPGGGADGGGDPYQNIEGVLEAPPPEPPPPPPPPPVGTLGIDDAIRQFIRENNPNFNREVPKGKPLKSKPVLAGVAVVVAGGIGLGVGLGSSGTGGHPLTPPTTTLAAPTTTTPVAASGAFAGYVCRGAQTTLFDNSNGGEVSNGGSEPTFSTNGKAYCLTYMQTYHWNDGNGSSPGSLGLIRVSGPAGLPSHVGMFPAKASSGQNNAANVNWYADVSISPPVVLDGTYSCRDSEPSTWSSDSDSGGHGFCIIYVDPAVPGP